ncbi:MAG: alcohol dehydrogenase catalytic domain-containing protein [Gemmatimonadetes bacterium]|nr:alcohol dehydrogenase catalytic domain-containing protein [Gemmatimonadota bacterium]
MSEGRDPRCEYCLTGDSHQCESYREHGITGLPGGFAEYVTVPGGQCGAYSRGDRSRSRRARRAAGVRAARGRFRRARGVVMRSARRAIARCARSSCAAAGRLGCSSCNTSAAWPASTDG